MVDVFALVSEAVLAGEYAADTLRRGQAYAADGSVHEVQFVDRGAEAGRVLAAVHGSAGRRYSVLLTVTTQTATGDVDVWSRCSCPVGDQCKHGAALAIVVSGEARQRELRRWERQLTDAVEQLDRPASAAAAKPVAIRADLHPASQHRWGRVEAGVHLRLLTQGAKGRWIKTGVTWGGIPSALARGTHRRDQLDGLRGLHAALMSSTRYYSAVDEPGLDEFGPLLWPSLAEALAAGVSLEPGTDLASAKLLDHPLDLAIDVVAAPGGARLTVGVRHEDRLWSGAEVLAVGSPVHGVVLLSGERPHLDAALAPLTAPVPQALSELLTADHALALPADERRRWEQVLLPRIARAVAVGSSDGSVEVRAPTPPRLRLLVDWSSYRAASLTWEWRYGEEPTAAACQVDSRDNLGGLRDAAAEDQVLRQLTESGAWPWRPVAADKVIALAALRLAVELLPRLREHGLVEVVERDRPDFRAAAADDQVEVSFETATEGPGDGPGDGPGEGAVDWLDLWVLIRVGDEQVPLPDVLAALTRGDEQIVLPSGLYVSADRPELKALHDLVRAAAEIREPEGGRLRVGRDDLGTWAQLGDSGVVDERAADWVRRAQALRDQVDLPAPEPTGVVSTLRDYQRQGFHWLAFLWETGLGGVLADDMGLGKTLQVLALFSHARVTDHRPFLVVAPTSVVTAWQSEAARHTPDLRVVAVASSSTRRGGISVATLAAEADVVVTTYTLLRLEAEQYADVDWAGLVLDEAQQVKNHTGKTHQAVRGIRAPFRLAVTGTPFENRLMELWSLLSITNPGLYPSAQSFTRQVVRPVERERDPEALQRFRARIKPFLLRRTKELVATDLPPKQEQVLEVQLPPRHRRLYDTHLQRERQKILGLMAEFDKNRIAIFSSLTRLRQLALDPVLVDPDQSQIGSAKLDLLVEHLGEIVAEGHRALVFSQFTSYLALVRERLGREGLATCYLDGRTRDRAAAIAEFRSGAAPVFLISLKAGGVGLTLTEADYVYVLDPWWNPATEAQAVDRAHRIGQDRPVMVYRLVSAETIEDKVMALKERKAELFAQVVDGDGLLGEAITADDVRSLVL